MLVSFLEFWALQYTINTPDATMAALVLLAAIPSVFILSSGMGIVYLKARYGNAKGVEKVVLGTLPVVIVFLLLWGFLLFILAILFSCAAGPC